MVTIIRTTPYSIVIADGDRTMKVLGESYARGSGSPDFVIQRDSINTWHSPAGDVPVDSVERERIVTALLDELTRRKWVVVAE